LPGHGRAGVVNSIPRLVVGKVLRYAFAEGMGELGGRLALFIFVALLLNRVVRIAYVPRPICLIASKEIRTELSFITAVKSIGILKEPYDKKAEGTRAEVVKVLCGQRSWIRVCGSRKGRDVRRFIVSYKPFVLSIHFTSSSEFGKSIF
jgi:hypothetical protein